MSLLKTDKVTRRDLLRRLLTRGGVTAAGGLFAYSALFEPNRPVLERLLVPVHNWPEAFDGLRVAFLSDLHVQPGFGSDRLAPALDLLRAERPDLILLGGDYCNEIIPDREEWLERCANALKGLTAPCGVFAIFGNHDFPVPPFDPPRRPWTDAGIMPLLDDTFELHRRGQRIFLVGLRSSLQCPYRGTEVIGKLPAGATKVVLLHEPAYVPEHGAAGASLMLSGHTHGGQIVLPGVGPLVLPARSNGYRSGLYYRESAAMPLYVSRGVGLLPPMLRFDCPPEVTLLTLRGI